MSEITFNYAQVERDVADAFGSSIANPKTVLLGFRDENNVEHFFVPLADSDEVSLVYFHNEGDESYAGAARLNDNVLASDELRYGYPVRIRQDVVNEEWVVEGRHPRLAAEFLAGLAHSGVSTVIVGPGSINLGLLTQTEPAASMRAAVTAARYTLNGATQAKAETLTDDFTAQAALLANGTAQFVLAQYDFAADAYTYKDGAVVGGAVALEVARAADANSGTLLPQADAGCFRVGFIKLVAGMTALVNGAHLFPDQEFFSKSSLDIFDLIMTDANGDVMVDANGNIMYGV